MKKHAAFFLIIPALVFAGEIERSSAQEKGEQKETISTQETKEGATTTVSVPETKSEGGVGSGAGEGAATERGEKGEEFKKAPESLKKDLAGEQGAEIEDVKARFKKLVEDEMKKFGALAEAPPGEGEKGKEGELKKEEKTEEDKKTQKEVTVEQGEKEVVPQPGEGEESQAEEPVEEGEEEVLEEEVPEEVPEVSPVEPEKPEEGRQKIALDFEDADIQEVITALAEILGINYIVDPKVKGKVNIHTSGEISAEDVFPILETILEVNGGTAVKVGNVYKIILDKDAKKQPLIPQIGKEVEDTSSPDRLILQIVPLRYIEAKEMEKIVKNFLGSAGVTVEYSERNILFIIDTSYNIKKILSLIDTVDVSVFDRMHVRFFELEASDAKDLAKELEDLFNVMGIEGKKKKGGEMVSFVPIERMNIILAVSSMPDIFDKVAEWIEKLDRVREDLVEQIFIYFVENAKAMDIGDILKEVYGGTRREKKEKKTTKRTTKERKTTAPPKVSQAKTGLETVTGEVTIVVDEVNNAILVKATPQDYAQVLKTIKLLDTIPKQVLIEVLIAEITLDRDTEFGIEWSLYGDYASLGGYKGNERVGQNVGLSGLGLDLLKPVSQTGFTYAFASKALEAFLKARASDNKVDILSSPHILVADNTEAKIEVGQEVPIVTSEYTPTTLQTATESFSRSIEYRDTGILLTVTPRINDKGLVALEISQEVSDVSEKTIEGINSPIILKRQAETSLVVQDGKTIIIGGLIREKKDTSKEGIPFLIKIPYLGKLFSFNKDLITKTELVMMITPHVVKTFEEAEMITSDFKEKVEGLKKLLRNR